MSDSTDTESSTATGEPHSGEPNTDSTATAETTDADTADTEGDNSDTFPRSYVEKLRRESQGYRERADQNATSAEQYAQRLYTEMVRATGRLADPSDLAFDQAHLDDPDSLSGAIDELLQRKPHLASRRLTGDIGQGASGNGSPVDLAGMLRARA
jgi:hypothetical protein